MPEFDHWQLLENESFLKWISQPDEALDRYWKDWISQDARRGIQVEYARKILQYLQSSPSTGDHQSWSKEIWQKIQQDIVRESRPRPVLLQLTQWAGSIAAMLIVAAGAAFWYWGGPHATPAGAVAFSSKSGNSILEVSNRSTQPQRVYLVDGSVVTLEPQAILSYPKFLNNKTREVHLRGNAFFQIAKDPSHPFLVRTGEIVTKVLGTSFRILSDASLADVRVVVRTGRVSVYTETDFNQGQHAFCVLLPHQEAVFHRKEGSLAFQPAAEERLTIPPPMEQPIDMDFDDAPLETIFGRLQSQYHIPIVYDKDSLESCRLTTSLEEERLSDKLDIICKAIGATYLFRDGSVVIQGGRCQ